MSPVENEGLPVLTTNSTCIDAVNDTAVSYSAVISVSPTTNPGSFVDVSTSK